MKRACDWIQSLQIVLAAVLVLACLAGLPFGVKPYIVLSGSMEPAIHTGALAYVDRSIERENVTPGDVIAFKAGEGVIVSHRVVRNNPDSETLATRGDANDKTDPSPARYENVVGETIFSIPFLGYVFKFLKDHWLLAACIVWLLNTVLALLSRIAEQKEKAGEDEWTQQQEETRNV